MTRQEALNGKEHNGSVCFPSLSLFLCRSFRLISTAFKTDMQWLLFTVVSPLGEEGRRQELVPKPWPQAQDGAVIVCDGLATLLTRDAAC